MGLGLSAELCLGRGFGGGTRVVGVVSSDDVYTGSEAHWEYINEGGLNMLLRYEGTNKDLFGRVLRLRKGEGSNGRLQEDSRFQSNVILPILDRFVDFGSMVQLDKAVVQKLNTDGSIQSSRHADRLSAKVKDLDTSNAGTEGSNILGMLCPDLTYCPDGVSYEIKLKSGVEECSDLGISRFTFLQCHDYPKKRDTLSRYNPVELFQAVLQGDAARLKAQLVHLRTASADQKQNNFRLLSGGEPSKVSDLDLEKLGEVLLKSPELFARLRALDFLAAGEVTEATAKRLYDAAGCPQGLSATHFEEAYSGYGKALLERLQATQDDDECMRVVSTAYEGMKPELGLALFLLGRTSHDVSLIVNVRSRRPGEAQDVFTSLRYSEVNSAGLWGRLTVIDTDIKPADRMPDYCQQLTEYRNHKNAKPLVDCVKGGGSVDEGLKAVQKALKR
ncbi:unnamed protein product [Polarella glacialis]|uniref:Inositol-pentakisphosphate 2-kinase n=1 Tax=Polarella glacialis TaxID=89957 RepID=A0A813EFW4_POLGL|nr:unnamed protein product [Polarella glacialis]CAE8597794.1 unnamed protein product [Polarella glacialis]|mmetsp:Transcript_14538/g.26009  ORF Transcript_14538/g.26009 Transcript_14538/m.26009 type:complete len:446 (-) Transcript_14538:37-1374(-)|eukprot:CAMPEP_0115061474 /NCGR_PEP_ID=MMETSP0227-20121206/8026_1 /TAXON_ID=89957 /ORGANISM="Polarella glacialis, Strain CCMP 1383" /LENGTH=445 /DNA_ID=CAMNT_0002446777 /DNA_START=56 /DNA_END=1393 /DNA_ORIENTATION=-